MAYIDEQPRYTSLIDLIDGGGAGRSGERFEGGGLLSILANALTRPYGYEDRLRDRKSDTAETITDVINEITEGRMANARQDQFERELGLLQDLRDPRNEGYASGFEDPMQGYPDMSMQPMVGVTMPDPMQDYPDMSMQPMEGVTTSMPFQNYESTLRQRIGMDLAPMVNTDPDPISEANLISMLYDDEIKRKQRGLGLGEMTGFEQARQMIMEQAPVLLENKTPQEQFEIIMLMKESRGL